MNVTTTTLPLHHRGLLEVIDTYGKSKPDFASQFVLSEIPTNELYEEIQQFSGLAPAQEVQEAGGITFDEVTTPYSKKFYTKIYAVGWETSYQAQAKDVYGKLKRPGTWFGISHYVTEQQAAADLINNSVDSDYTGIDGVVLASASHPTASSTFSNLSTAAALSVSSLETMLNDVLAHKAYRDFPFPTMGPFNLIIPRQLNQLAKRILATSDQPGTTDNDKNVARDMIRYVGANLFLTSSTRYALISADKEENPFFRLKHKDMQIIEDIDARKPSRLFVAMKEYTYGWKRAQGTQFNAGA